MNKYELAVVVSAKIEDDARAEVVEKVKALVSRFGGNVKLMLSLFQQLLL